MYDRLKSEHSGKGLRIGLVVSRYHASVTEALRDAAAALFAEAGGATEDLTIVPAPGAFELPTLCRALAVRGDIDAIVAIGCVIKGETSHDQHISDAVAQGLTQLSVDTGVPIAFGVLTCHTMEQAEARSGRSGTDKPNKGAEAMAAAIETACTLRALQSEVTLRPATGSSERCPTLAKPVGAT